MRTHTALTQAALDPKTALDVLVEGNERFQKNLKANRNLLQQVNETSSGQFPFAAILSCIDSRTSAELIFDQGLGDIFSIRIAGNFINDDILGSMEFACLVAGSKLIVVLGHTNCGAITAACQGPAEGYIGSLIENIRPAVEEAQQKNGNQDNSDNFLNQVAAINVRLSIEHIRKKSSALAKLESSGKIGIAGALYDVKTGVVTFL
ncbi:carbonic anhydrase [Chlamydiales bacterium]|nr:carbonic anhydrase [Chlamydiales bacterium]